MQLSEYTNYLKKFGPLYTMREIFFRFCHNILEKYCTLIPEKICISSLKKYLAKIKTTDIIPPQPHLENTKPHIWTCWLQGYDNAPPIVKACINSMYKYANEYDVIIITNDNINTYVTFPPHIMEKYKSGKIPTAHFTDLLRTLLLINYGGVWLDATVLLTKDIPKPILESDLFYFQSSILQVRNFSPCSSWFITAKKNNPVLRNILQVLFLYWEKHNSLSHYFIYHLCVYTVITYDEKLKSLWQRIPYKNNSDPHYLQFHLFDEFDPSVWQHIMELSFAHKLTYKFAGAALTEKSGTYYKRITTEAAP